MQPSKIGVRTILNEPHGNDEFNSIGAQNRGLPIYTSYLQNLIKKMISEYQLGPRPTCKYRSRAL